MAFKSTSRTAKHRHNSFHIFDAFPGGETLYINPSISFLIHLIIMNHLVHYYLHHAGCGAGHSVGTIYAHPHFLQRVHQIGIFWGGLWLFVRPRLSKGAKTIGSGALVTGRNMVSDMAWIPILTLSFATSYLETWPIRRIQ